MIGLEERANLSGAVPLMDSEHGYVRLLECEHYAEAQAAVDKLSDNGFEVFRTAIIGEGLHVYERITGRLDWMKALMEGAINGLGTGLIIGLLFWLFALADGATSAAGILLVALAAGAVIGAIFRLISYLAMRGKRDFTSIGSLRASNFAVTCEAGYADQARKILEQ